MKKFIAFAAAGVLALALFLTAVENIGVGASAQGREQLELALRQAAVSCYASEGSYPPGTDYIERHYGVRIDRENYIVGYELIAENLMPEITVLERVS